MFYDDPNISKLREEGVWVGKNFVSQEDCESIVRYVENFSDEDWLDGWARHQGTLFYTNEPESEKLLQNGGTIRLAHQFFFQQ